MAIGFGEGAEIRRPMAVTVIGGIAVATLLTLIVIPVLYAVLDRKRYASPHPSLSSASAAERVPKAGEGAL
jgi:HAE1 family hydrophobic/amphiphilic exporter-1